MSKEKITPRIMIAKPGLDGHDRGAVVVVQGLRDEGFDVIYTGLRRTAKEIAIAAAQEDVDVLGLSVLSGAHMTVLSTILEELDKLFWRPSLLVAGGIIPAKDEASLKKLGFDLIFGPGTSLKDIGENIRKNVPSRCIRKNSSKIPWVQTSAHLTELELNGVLENESLLKPNKKSRIVLLSGQGGVGKSTLIGEFIQTASKQNKSIAVIANDPSGAQGRGAILADRLRMPMDKSPEKCLIRSIPVSDASLGISKEVGSMATLLSNEYDLVIVETLGLGQHQYLEADWVDLSIAVVAPGTGDHWQLRKSAILDVCDHIFITKSDTPNFEVFQNDVTEVLHDKRKDKMPTIISVSQKDKESILIAFKSLF